LSLANQLTILRMLLTPIFAIFLALDDVVWQYVALAIFIVASVTDWYDGYVARKTGTTTLMGKYLDPLADKMLVSTAFGILAYLGYLPLWMFLVMACRDLGITGLRAYAIKEKVNFETNVIAKWKTASQMIALYLLLLWTIISKQFANDPTFINFKKVTDNTSFFWSLMFFVTIYTALTGIIYLFENRLLLRKFTLACYRVLTPSK